MAVLIKDLLSLPLLRAARVVAGADMVGQRAVSWVSVIERPVEGFVRPGEMVLTCGTGCTPKMFRELVQQVIDSGAAGIGVGVGKKREVSSVPRVVRAMAEARQFPVLEIPWEVRFTDISRAAANLILADGHAAVDDRNSVKRKFTDLILSGLGFDAIAAALEQVLRRPVVMLDSSFRLQAAGNRTRSVLGEAGLARCRQAHRRLEANDTAALETLLQSRTPSICPGIPVLGLGAGLSVAVVVNRDVLGYLYAVETDETTGERVPSVEAYALEQASMAVTVEALRQRAVAETESRLSGDFLWELAMGQIHSPQEIETRATLLGYKLKASYYLMVLQSDGDNRANGGAQPDERVHEELESALVRTARQFALKMVVARRSTAVLVLIEAAGGSRPPLRKWVEQVQKDLLRPGSQRISAAMANNPRPLTELASGYAEALRTLKVGRVVLGPGCVADAAELRPFLMLGRLGEDLQACETAAHVLAPLIKYREKSNRDLLRTLEVYLQENGNASATARKLLLNRHSLLYRLGKIESLTGYTLHRYQDLFVLNLSLKLWRMGALREDRSHRDSPHETDHRNP